MPIRLLVALGLLAGLLAFAANDTPRTGLDPAEPEDFIVRVDELIGGGGTGCHGCVMDLDAWQAEILPWFVEEGVVPFTNPPRSVWAFHQDDRANHVLGQADCAGRVWMNARYVNPASSWYRRAEFLATFVHELVHSQQFTACRTESRELVETTAQVVSLEILAAMANNGNRHAAVALLNELQGIVLSELRWQSLRSPAKAERLDRLTGRIMDPWEQAERAQRWRYWNGPGRRERDFVLRAYAHDPYVLLLRALERGYLDGLALMRVYGEGYPPEARVPRIRFDDLAWFLAHAESLFPEEER